MSKKYKQVKINLDPSIHKELQEYCNLQDVTMAEMFRSILNINFSEKRERKNTRIHKVTDPQLLYHLNKIGNNLNQIAKHVNEGNTFNIQILSELTQIENNLKGFLNDCYH